jgi:hypothetical protein
MRCSSRVGTKFARRQGYRIDELVEIIEDVG